MIFSKLSIFFAATLAAFATAAPSDTYHPNCGNNPVKCCLDSFPATAAYTNLARNKLGVNIAIGTEVWSDCNQSQGQTCLALSVCCTHSATDGSIATGCKCIGDCN